MAQPVPATLRELRHQRGLTLSALAVLCEAMDGPHISRIERGLIKPRPATIVRMARALGLDAMRMKAILENPTPDLAGEDDEVRAGAGA
jgi:transcriptional regulator with XRE-family HTH domain